MTTLENLSLNHIGLNAANTSQNGTSGGNNSPSFDNLYTVILQCFAIILAGYIAGRAKLITSSQGKGIGTFVGQFCLPALLFRSMVVLNFSQVNWYFLLGILISKTIVFVAVAGLTLLLKRPLHLGFAGLFAIFATQSNDFALGYPILKALYWESHPEYLQYIYLVAPISLVLLNPIGFTMLEIHRRSEDTGHRSGRCRLVLYVLRDVLSNPIVFMVLIGIAGNFVLHQKVPNMLDNILEVLGNAFSASALFYLGLSLVGKVQGQMGVGLIVPFLLIMAKTLLLPLITWQVVGALEMHQPLNDSRSLSMYAFLYGTFPTAPSVFLYSSHFSIAQDIVATGMVVCTFLSAPLMFASAKMMTVVVESEMDYKSMLLNTSFDLSVISLVCNAWILLVLFFSGKHKKMPHQFLIALVLAHSLASIGMIVYDGVDSYVEWKHYLQFVILLLGVFSTRCFAAVISMVLYMLHCKSLCFVLIFRIWLFIFAIGFPMLGTGLLLLLGDHHMNNEIDPSFHYGSNQALLSLIVLSVCSLINITFLVLRQRNSRHQPDPRPLKKRTESSYTVISEADDSYERLLPDGEEEESSQRQRSSSKSKLLSGTECQGENSKYQSLSCGDCTEDCGVTLLNQQVTPRTSSIEDIVPFPEDMQRSVVTQGRAVKHTTRSAAEKSHQHHDNNKCDHQGNGDAGWAGSHASSQSEDSLTDTIQKYECHSGKCSYQQRQQCAGLLRCYHASSHVIQVPDTENEGKATEVKFKKTPEVTDEFQTDKFVITLIAMQISMFVGLFLCTWRLFNDAKSGIYVEIEFLDGFLNFGQSLIFFAVFGFDTKLMILPCLRKLRKCLYGVEVVHLPAKSEITPEDLHLCEQFEKYHREHCEKSIVRNMKYRFRTYDAVFCGSALCNWLIKVGLCQGRSEAISYGRTLVRGRVICHVTSEHDFHDMPYFYRFCDENEELE
ncbi:integral membrane protein GPR155-like isoform X2 [Dreissena polymorpha]|uniref:integral membrane protein GPR155-like isoform X2 n=1 Tax=Dreissena polymorpha TaxID=45954 RepID=UPI0022644C0B|nr:integral membrane protein GPR155-like isoform X2 [Dreissena polymorpha]